MKVERIGHRQGAASGLWISMGKSLAEGSGRLQAARLSPPFRFHPQIRKGKKVPKAWLWKLGIFHPNPQASAMPQESSCLQKRVERINPAAKRPTIFIRLSSKDS
jgi:hypothetical protein